MKKENIQMLFVCVVVAIVTSFLTSNLNIKLTGNPILDNQSTILPIAHSCYDSDSGINLTAKGLIFVDGQLANSDICVFINGYNNSLKEYYCNESNLSAYYYYSCPFGCYDGACVSPYNNQSVNNQFPGDTLNIKNINATNIISKNITLDSLNVTLIGRFVCADSKGQFFLSNLPCNSRTLSTNSLR